MGLIIQLIRPFFDNRERELSIMKTIQDLIILQFLIFYLFSLNYFIH
jgi:hypothetical protein